MARQVPFLLVYQEHGGDSPSISTIARSQTTGRHFVLSMAAQLKSARPPCKLYPEINWRFADGKEEDSNPHHFRNTPRAYCSMK